MCSSPCCAAACMLSVSYRGLFSVFGMLIVQLRFTFYWVHVLLNHYSFRGNRRLNRKWWQSLCFPTTMSHEIISYPLIDVLAWVNSYNKLKIRYKILNKKLHSRMHWEQFRWGIDENNVRNKIEIAFFENTDTTLHKILVITVTNHYFLGHKSSLNKFKFSFWHSHMYSTD